MPMPYSRAMKYLVALAALCALGSAHGATLDECSTLFHQIHIAYDAKDWKNGEKLAERSVKVCSSAASAFPYFVSMSYSFLGNIQEQQSKWNAALKTADACIQLYYANAGCHNIRWVALGGLSRVKEGANEFIITRSVAQSTLSTEPTPSDNALYKAYLAKAKEEATSILAETSPEAMRAQGLLPPAKAP